MIFLLIVLFLLIVFLPCYAAFLQKNYQLVAITFVCGLLSFFIIPYIFSVILVTRKLPKTQKTPFSFGFFAGFWVLLLLLFFILPFMSFRGLSMNGYQFFQLSSLSDSASTQVVFFLISVVLGCVLSLLLRQRALYTGEMILMLNGYFFFALLAFSLFHYNVASYGTYILLLVYALGIASMYYTTIVLYRGQSFSQEKAPQEVSSNSEALREAGSQAVSALSKAAGAIGSAVKTSISEANNTVTVRCIQGMFAGAGFPLKEGEQLTLGSDPASSNLVLSSPEISRLHCTIRFTGQNGVIQIIDSSTNGTFCPDGRRLPKNQPIELPLPCTIFFGNQPQIFEITKG